MISMLATQLGCLQRRRHKKSDHISPKSELFGSVCPCPLPTIAQWYSNGHSVATCAMFSRVPSSHHQGRRFLLCPATKSCGSNLSARMASTLPKLPIFEAIAGHDPQATAIIHSESRKSFSYGQLLHDVSKSTEHLGLQYAEKPIKGQRISFLVENSYDYVGAHNSDEYGEQH